MRYPNPLLLTATLSLATLLGYGAYRVWYADAARDDRAGAARAAGDPALLADSLPSVTLADLDGTLRSIDEWRDRPLVINFWATWCAPCLREIPLLKSLQAARPDLQVIGIAVDRPDPVAQFAAEMGFNYPILVGQGDAMDAATAFGIEVFVLPSTVFTAPSGAILGVHVGEIHTEHLDNLTATLAALDSGTLDIADARRHLAGQR